VNPESQIFNFCKLYRRCLPDLGHFSSHILHFSSIYLRTRYSKQAVADSRTPNPIYEVSNTNRLSTLKASALEGLERFAFVR
jgi:hypothetical protein